MFLSRGVVVHAPDVSFIGIFPYPVEEVFTE
jgi:hypothetical protein